VPFDYRERVTPPAIVVSYSFVLATDPQEPSFSFSCFLDGAVREGGVLGTADLEVGCTSACDVFPATYSPPSESPSTCAGYEYGCGTCLSHFWCFYEN
jgi:hypothetical protein